MVRWLPMMVLGPGGIGAVSVVELATAAARRDRRSMTGWLAGTTTRTRNDLARLPSAREVPVSS